MYIGKTSNPASRISTHKESKLFDRVTYFHLSGISIKESDAIERSNIDHYNPPYNNNTRYRHPNGDGTVSWVKNGKVITLKPGEYYGSGPFVDYWNGDRFTEARVTRKLELWPPRHGEALNWDSIIKTGRYKGKTLRQVPDSYIESLIVKGDMNIHSDILYRFRYLFCPPERIKTRKF